MYSLAAGVYKAYFASPELKVLLVGGPGVGKTTLLERVKVTQFSSPSSSSSQQHQRPKEHCPPSVLGLDDSSHHSDSDWDTAKEEVVVETPKPKRMSLWICPAPQRYAAAVVDDDDEQDGDLMEDIALTTASTELSKSAAQHQQQQPQEQSLASTSLSAAPDATSSPCPHCSSTKPLGPDFDLKPGSKMLSATRIRPTIGMNLGKNIKMSGTVQAGRHRKRLTALVQVWDIGGKFRNLWERYYQECDAVVFVYKVPPRQDYTNGNGKVDDDDDDDDKLPELTPIEQQHLLEQVRAAIPDDIPLMVFGHLFSSSPKGSACQSHGGDEPIHTDLSYSTTALLPHYHNASQALFFGNAATGQGVKTALEWLIGLAVTQQQLRERDTSKNETSETGEQ